MYYSRPLRCSLRCAARCQPNLPQRTKLPFKCAPSLPRSGGSMTNSKQGLIGRPITLHAHKLYIFTDTKPYPLSSLDPPVNSSIIINYVTKSSDSLETVSRGAASMSIRFISNNVCRLQLSIRMQYLSVQHRRRRLHNRNVDTPWTALLSSVNRSRSSSALPGCLVQSSCRGRSWLP